MARKPSILLSYQARAKERIKDLKETKMEAEADLRQVERETHVIVKNVNREINRLEKTLPQKRKYKPRKAKATVTAKAEDKIEPEAKRPTAFQKPKVTGSFGTGILDKSPA